jgi:predicted RNA-binding Zn-ribbon protein involved in translation (DUF1610 family)
MKKPKWEWRFEKLFPTNIAGMKEIHQVCGIDFVVSIKDFIKEIEQEAFARGWSECDSARADIEFDKIAVSGKCPNCKKQLVSFEYEVKKTDKN